MVVRKVASVVLMWLIVLGFSAFYAGDAVAESITGVTIEDYSGKWAADPTIWVAEHIIDGSGLNPDGSHETGGLLPWSESLQPSSTMWMSNAAKSPYNEYDHYVKFDLGAQFDLDTVRIWNFNECITVSRTHRGVKDLKILGSVDDVTYTLMKTVVVPEAPGDRTYDFSKTFSEFSNASNIRYVMFDINSNHDGAVFPTNETGGRLGDDEDYGFAGLSEVRFSAVVPVPEPGTLTLLVIGSLGLLLCRFRGRSAK